MQKTISEKTKKKLLIASQVIQDRHTKSSIILSIKKGVISEIREN